MTWTTWIAYRLEDGRAVFVAESVKGVETWSKFQTRMRHAGLVWDNIHVREHVLKEYPEMKESIA